MECPCANENLVAMIVSVDLVALPNQVPVQVTIVAKEYGWGKASTRPRLWMFPVLFQLPGTSNQDALLAIHAVASC